MLIIINNKYSKKNQPHLFPNLIHFNLKSNNKKINSIKLKPYLNNNYLSIILLQHPITFITSNNNLSKPILINLKPNLSSLLLCFFLMIGMVKIYNKHPSILSNHL